MLHSGWFVAAGTVISVGSAAYGAYASSENAKKAAGATGRAGESLTKEQQQARDEAMAKLAAATGQLTGSLKNIQAPQWNVARDIKDAGQITDYNVAQLEKIFPGAKTQRQIAARATTAYLRGEIPQDVKDQIMRSVAELGGAGFTPPKEAGPQPSGFQAAQGLLARQLGLTSLDLQMKGQDLSQRWQTIAGAFIESPLQVGQSRLQFEQAGANLEMQKAAAIYNAQAAEANLGYTSGINIAQGRYGTAVDTIGANLAASQALSSGIASTGQALGSGISGYGSAMGMQSLAASQGAMGGATGTAKYGTPEYSRAVSNPNTQYLGVGTKAQQASMATDTPATVTWLNKAYRG